MDPGRRRFAGRRLDVHITQGAVSDTDVWFYDRRTRVAVWATPFRIAIPGHGAPMTREQFNTYRLAYGAFIGCVNSEAEAATCAAGWTTAIAPLASVGDAAGAADTPAIMSAI